MTALTFNNTKLDIIDRDGQRWLTAAQIGMALEYADDKAIQRIYTRHKSEFRDNMTGVVNLTTPSGMQECRIFSSRGAWLLAMFARTRVAEKFREWVLDVLERQISPTIATPALPSPHRRGGLRRITDRLETLANRLETALPAEFADLSKAARFAVYDGYLIDLSDHEPRRGEQFLTITHDGMGLSRLDSRASTTLSNWGDHGAWTERQHDGRHLTSKHCVVVGRVVRDMH